MTDKKIIVQFDQAVELIIEGLAARSGRDFKEVLEILQQARVKGG
jgi:hypothetical protein